MEATKRVIQFGVIGCGHWGPNHIRNFAALDGATVIACADPDPARLKAMSALLPGIETKQNYRHLLTDDRIDAVIIATPTATHFNIALEALKQGKHVLVEKPLTREVAQCEQLRRVAKARKLVLMVGHTFLFNTGVHKLKECIESGDAGKIYYMHSTRTNLGPIRRDVGVIWDLASHDVAIFNYLLNSQPVEVSARGEQFFRKNVEDVAFISLSYPNHILANIHVSWLDPKKVRQVVITGSKKMLSWDDLATTGPVMIYDKGVMAYQDGTYHEPYYRDYGDFRLLTREGDIVIPRIKAEEPLRSEARHFLECIRGSQPNTLTGPETGIAVVKALVAIEKSMAAGGKPVKVR